MKKNLKQYLLKAALAMGVGCFPIAVQADNLSQMVSPVSNPVQFEDPRINTEIRPIFMYHEIDDSFLTGGGDVQLYALQARFALTDRLALIATKDGFVDFNPTGGLPQDEGFADIGVGLKYAFYQDEEAGQIATFGLRYEIPVGESEVFQGEGDGDINPFISGAMNLGAVNVMAATGFRFALDNDYSSFYDFDLHVDYPIGSFYPALELNLVHVLDAGNQLPLSDEGFDLFNFGSANAGGENMITGAVAGRYRYDDSLDFGLAYQFPLDRGEGTRLTDWRITADMIFSFSLT